MADNDTRQREHIHAVRDRSVELAQKECVYSQGERDLFRFQEGTWSRVM